MTLDYKHEIKEKSISGDTLSLVSLQQAPEIDSGAYDCQATPGVTTWVEYGRGLAGVESPAGSTQNSIPLPPYPDVGDNVYANVNEWLALNCGDSGGRWYIPGVCENGHRIAKIIACGKEWCPVCGELGSIAHNRRYVRWLPKIMQFKRMRYLVFTIPEAIRSQYRHKEDLTELGRRVQKLMQRHGHSRGLRRWHWFGDKSHKWHPHLNVLVEGGYIPAKELDSLKAGWGEILGVDGKENVHNQYKGKPGDMAGCLHYVTRATFLDYEWDIEMAQELRGFRNMVVWGKGKWEQSPVWGISPNDRINKETGEEIDVEAIEKLVNHQCPKCGAKIHWDKALPAKLLDLVDKESLGAGYYQVKDRASPLPLDDDVEENLAYMQLVFMARLAGKGKPVDRLAIPGGWQGKGVKYEL